VNDEVGIPAGGVSERAVVAVLIVPARQQDERQRLLIGLHRGQGPAPAHRRGEAGVEESVVVLPIGREITVRVDPDGVILNGADILLDPHPVDGIIEPRGAPIPSLGVDHLDDHITARLVRSGGDPCPEDDTPGGWVPGGDRLRVGLPDVLVVDRRGLSRPGRGPWRADVTVDDHVRVW
jgi:hypothetical protein